MAIILNDIYQKTKQQFKLHLIAGKNGMSRIMRWIYIAEDIDNLSFLKGGELAISTGLSLSQCDHWLHSFILALIEHDACGLILNVGKYIQEKDITPDIYQLCDKYQFPLFLMPWEIFLSDISQTYSNYIFQDNQRIDTLAGAFKTVIRYESPQPEAHQILIDSGCQDLDNYFVSVIDISESSPPPFSSQFETISRRISSFLLLRKINFSSFDYQKRLILVWHQTEKTYAEPLFEPLLQMLRELSVIGTVHMGIGSCITGFQNLRASYKQACAALTMATYQQCSYYDFDNFGIYQIFFSITDKELLHRLSLEKIGFLEDYDASHNTSYMETLECYLKYNGHVAAMADAMICHRNTINYRLRQLKDLLGKDMEDGDVRFELQMACSIRRYLHIFKE